MNEDAKSLLVEMSRGVQLTFTNAEELYTEADLLRYNGSMNRALLLHQISLEECGKADIIGNWATNLFLGGDVDISKMTKAFRSHRVKNYVNAYYSHRSPEESDAIIHGDTKAAMESFRKFQKKYHDELNYNKNAALYVDFKNNRFSTPSEIISEEMVIEIRELNARHLDLTATQVKTLKRMVNDDGALKVTTEWFKEQVLNLKTQKVGATDTTIKILMQEFIEKYIDEKDSETIRVISKSIGSKHVYQKSTK